ncbi:MAG TPA: sorbosone dehydrogenase family protein [Chitinophagales bacterium]|nr:sorbosone dehydrogenase family protein [Chitinophagales bacterium]
MKTMLLLILWFPVLLMNSTCFNKSLQKVSDPRLADIKLPQGFKIALFARDVENARSLTLGEKGTVFVGNRSGDKVFALVDQDQDGEAEKKYLIAEGMNSPNGVAFRDGSLYVAEIDKIWRFDKIEEHLDNPGKPVLLFDSLPDDGHHGWKYIAFGPDGKLYIPVGAPCNICDDNEKDARYSSITRINADGTGFEVFAHGIRNTVGFDWHPSTGALWFTDNGRDMMGDDLPPDELNAAPKAGMNFGYPYCHAGDIPDPEFGKKRTCDEFTKPIAKLAPHTAALGMKFYEGNSFPAEYHHQVFIAEHGSWNRSTAIGYRVMLVKLDGERALSYEVFAEGWLKDGKAWGRPVDVLELKDGSLLISDDFANAVYRVTYTGK